MKIKQIFLQNMTIAMLAIMIAPQMQAQEFNLQDADVHDRMTYHRAIDMAVWAMPLMNFKFYRGALIDAGVNTNDIGYFSELQNWKFQTATPNNTTPYILTHWNMENGPIVIEIPASTSDVGLFGSIMDAWQRPMDDVGALGRDKGKGATGLKQFQIVVISY